MRGSVAGEAVVSQASTEEFREGYARTFGDRKPQRGRWVWDDVAQRLVPVDEYQAPSEAKNAPIMVDRFMEGAATTDGVDIGSRRKRQEYMRQNGAADASDYSKGFYESRRVAKERATAEATKRSVIEVSKLDTRHIPKFLEEGKKR